MNSARIYRYIGFAGVTFFLASALTPLAHFVGRWLGAPSDLEPADAIVVLGSNISGEVLSYESAVRAYHGIALYQRGLAPLLVFSGSAREGGPTEAEARAELARARGIPAEAILMEMEAHTTREEAAREWALLQPKGIRKILLVTNSLHMARARPVFERAGFQVRSAPADLFSDPHEPEQRLLLMRRVLEEVFGWLYYRVAGFA